MNKKPLYKAIANTLQAYQKCIESDNKEWQDKHESRLEFLTYNYMPSGSGIDAGITLDMESSKEDKLIFNLSYHHMNDHGYYDGWTDHKLIVTPSLTSDFNLRITGKNRNDVKDFHGLAELKDLITTFPDRES